MTWIVFDALYETSLLKHFQIIFDTLTEALGFEIFFVLVEKLETILIFGADVLNRAIERFLRCGIVGVWKDTDFFWLGNNFSRQWVDDFDFFNSVKAEFDAIGMFTRSRENIYYVATNPEVTALKSNIIAVVLYFGECANEFVNIKHLTARETDGHFAIVFGRTDAVNTRNWSND